MIATTRKRYRGGPIVPFRLLNLSQKRALERAAREQGVSVTKLIKSRLADLLEPAAAKV